MSGAPSDRGTRRGLGWALLAVNVVMLLFFVGAAGSVSLARETLERGTGVCVDAARSDPAAARLPLPTPPGSVRFVAPDTLRYEARTGSGRPVTVTCRFAEPDQDATVPELLSVEVTS